MLKGECDCGEQFEDHTWMKTKETIVGITGIWTLAYNSRDEEWCAGLPPTDKERVSKN